MSVEDNDPNQRDNFTFYYEDLAQFLKPTAVLVFGKIKRTGWREGFSYMPVPRMADELGMDRNTVSLAIKKLLEEKLIVDVTKQFWDRYQKILQEQGYKKSSKYSKPIHLYSVNMNRYDELVSKNIKTIKTFTYEEVFGEASELGKISKKVRKTYIQNEKNQHINEENSQEYIENPENEGEKFAKDDRKTPMNIETNKQNIEKVIEKEERKNKENSSTRQAGEWNDSSNSNSQSDSQNEDYIIPDEEDEDWGGSEIEYASEALRKTAELIGNKPKTVEELKKEIKEAIKPIPSDMVDGVQKYIKDNGIKNMTYTEMTSVEVLEKFLRLIKEWTMENLF